MWDDEADRWERVQPWDIRPGMLVMLKHDAGGYDTTEGWTGDKAHVLADVPRAGRGATLRDDSWTEAACGCAGLVADLLGPWRAEEKSDVGIVPHTEPRHLGPFSLAHLEALVRVADGSASQSL